jgi:hypothetical protein
MPTPGPAPAGVATALLALQKHQDRLARRPQVREAVFSTATPTAGQESGPYGVRGPATAFQFRVLATPAGSSSTTVELHRNGSSIGSVTVTAGTTSGAVALHVALSDGDLLTVVSTAVGTGVTSVTAHADLEA